MRLGVAWVALGAVLAVTPVRAEWATAGDHDVPLEGTGASWLVHATLNGNVSGLFLVDTGASYCVIGPNLAQRLHAPMTGEQVELRTGNGIVRAPVVRVQTVDVGHNRAHDVPAVVHTAVSAPADGIIGLSYLNNFSYAIDPKRKILRLR
jgi:clan AA aspartic protease (TIGR02281 family)